MSPRLKTLLVQVGSVVLGGGLLYLALRNVDFGAVGDAFAGANYWYLLPLAAAALGAHALRAWRWQMLLAALPDEAGRPARVGFGAAFASVMIGYMVNYAAPRLGEVARSANLASRARLPFSGVLGTVVSERVLDVLTLGLLLLRAPLLVADQLGALVETLRPGAVLETVSAAGWVLALVAVAVVVGVALLVRLALRWSVRQEGLARRVADALRAFRGGLASVLRSPHRLGLVATTAGIWACYLLMAYLPLRMLGIADLGLADAWVLLVVGTFGVMVPSPGGVGSYHYVTIRTMEGLLGVAAAPATAYAVLGHAAQLVLYTAVGFLCLLLQGTGLRALRAPEVVDEGPSPVVGRP